VALALRWRADRRLHDDPLEDADQNPAESVGVNERI
jgi:hypothetical protein